MSEVPTGSNRTTSVSTPSTTSSKNNGKATTPDHQRQRTTRSAPDAAKIYLTKTKSELYALSTSASKWQEWRMSDCTSDLYAKGFLPQMQGMSPSFNMLSHVVLRIAASLPPNSAVASDALRAVAVAMDMKRVDHAVESVAENVVDILAAVRALTAPDETPDTLTGNMHAAAVRLTRTVDEQATALATSAERLEEELQGVAQRVQTRVEEEDRPATVQDSPPAPRAADKTARSAAAAAQALPPAPAAALANAAARARQILIEKTPGLTQWMDGMDEKALVDRARHTTSLMSDDALSTAPSGAKFVGATILRSGAVLLHLNSTAAASWVKANITEFIEALGGASVYRERLYNVVVQYVPVSFEPERGGACSVVEDDNSLPRGALVKARWIKPVVRRRQGQRVAHAVLGFGDTVAANRVIRDGAWINGAKVWGHKLLTEPIRCMKCQAIGANHIATNCRSIHDSCARCGEMHRTSECAAPDNERACCNCRAAQREYRGHGAADRSCPTFEVLLQNALERNPEAAHPYFLDADDPTTWVTHDEVGAAFAAKRGVPEWKRKPAVQRGPGPSPPVAAAQRRQMARGGQGPMRGGARQWSPVQSTLDSYLDRIPQRPSPPSQGSPPTGPHVDARMHADRVAQLTPSANMMDTQDAYRTAASTSSLIANGRIDWATEMEARQATAEYGLAPINEDSENDLVPASALLDSIQPPAEVDGENV